MFSDKILEISFSDLSNKFATLDNKRGKSEDASDSKNSDFIGIICKDSNKKLLFRRLLQAAALSALTARQK